MTPSLSAMMRSLSAMMRSLSARARLLAAMISLISPLIDSTYTIKKKNNIKKIKIIKIVIIFLK
jgi:hypothetical protein